MDAASAWFAVGGAAALALVRKSRDSVQSPSKLSGGSPSVVLEPFRVMSWNVLASVHTHYVKTIHKGDRCESSEWRCRRHKANIRRIVKESPDVVLLQEVDAWLIPEGWEGGVLPCGLPLDGYSVVQSYGPTGSDSKGPAEGVVILLRKGVWELDPDADEAVAKFGKTKRRGQKCGLTVHARRSHDHTQKCAFSTVHLQFDKNASPTTTSEGKLGNLRDALKVVHRDTPVILAGDFNTM
jgi:hypothetical protein